MGRSRPQTAGSRREPWIPLGGSRTVRLLGERVGQYGHKGRDV